MEVINLPNGETFRTSNEEAAEFIRGILDLSEEKLILTADKYANK